MEIVWWIIGVLAALVAFVLIYAATKPNEFQTLRRTHIAAPPGKVYPLIEDFRNWAIWSPWEKMEKEGELARTFSGAARGVGAGYAWLGKKTGQGKMDIVEVRPDELVRIRLEFIKPFAALNTTDFVLRPDGEGTEVTWSMQGPQPYFFKLMGTLFNSDKMVGGAFERGLRDMKQAAEAA